MSPTLTASKLLPKPRATVLQTVVAIAAETAEVVVAGPAVVAADGIVVETAGAVAEEDTAAVAAVDASVFLVLSQPRSFALRLRSREKSRLFFHRDHVMYIPYLSFRARIVARGICSTKATLQIPRSARDDKRGSNPHVRSHSQAI